MNQAIPEPLPVHSSGAGTCRSPKPQRVRSDTLLQGARRLIIEHDGASYTLLLTRNDKLILTK